MVTLEKLKPEQKDFFTEWLKNDAVGMKFLSSYATPADWFHLVNGTDRICYIAYSDGKPFGFFDFEIKGDRGHFVIYVAQEYRRRGLAGELLDAAFELDTVKSVSLLDVGVEKDNEGSRKLLEHKGFTISGKDEDGMLVYIKEI